MKYVKFFEKVDLESKSEEYQEYIDKFVVLEYKDNLYLAKFIGISLEGYYIRIDNYEWQPKIHEWYIERVDGLHLEDIKVLFNYDTLEEAEKQYELLLDSNKYNV